jgi:inhibitor of cysteine peptidase
MENSNDIRNDFVVEVGDKMYVELCSNPTTGFEWSYEMSNQGIIIEEEYDFEESTSDLPGAPGKDLWTFEAIKTGNTIIDMSYSQPWDGGIKNELTYVINVTVE